MLGAQTQSHVDSSTLTSAGGERADLKGVISLTVECMDFGADVGLYHFPLELLLSDFISTQSAVASPPGGFRYFFTGLL